MTDVSRPLYEDSQIKIGYFKLPNEDGFSIEDHELCLKSYYTNPHRVIITRR